ncbi:glutathione synthase [Hyphobacterium marinum]|uniref:Glutathione synthetase n=1 Tax=Hyphobacterium marinum TaxID=3116574 RepID=A0ABU7LV37_9PROT|nr:glutathione synthase [Hyphobacterium sp. Y6023]MEE2565422.1 glutathione synthase [Hyphobacterium sp. Y6023]
MVLRVAVQMDPISGVDIRGDTSFALIETAQARGAKVWTYQPKHLSWNEGRITAVARPVTVRREQGNHADEGAPETLDLAEDIDVILMRQDPPFDMGYITAAHILEELKGRTLVLNDPEWVRSSPEKLLPLKFPDLIPPTLISRDLDAIKAFRKTHRDIILKPLYGNGGAGVFRVKEDDGNFSALTEMFFAASREPIIAQAFLPVVSEGDRRVILIDGEGVGVINRRPQPGETRSNMHVGGAAEPAELSEADRHICARIGPLLKERGLVLVGIDVIGDRLTEINVTSPTGVQELKRFSGVDASALFWDAVDRRLKTG